MHLTLTYSDSNGTEHSLLVEGGLLNLRQLIETRQRQLSVDPMSSSTYEPAINEASLIEGNYTCSVANIHGTKSATLTFQLQGE